MSIDWDLWLRISTNYKFDYVDEPLLNYRMGHTGQMSKNIGLREYCNDMLRKNFVRNNPKLLPKLLIRKAFAYSHLELGYCFREIDTRSALKNYLLAIRYNYFEIKAYWGFLRTLLKAKRS